VAAGHAVEKVLDDFFHGQLAGCGKTACRIAGMRSRTRSVRENRRFSCLEKVPEDFFHGQRTQCRDAIPGALHPRKPEVFMPWKKSWMTFSTAS